MFHLRLFSSVYLLSALVAQAQPNLVLLISPPGDYIGLGQTYHTTNQAEIGISGTAAAIQITAFDFAIEFEAPGHSNFMVGQYSNALAYTINGDFPGLSIFGNGRSCLNNSCGDFEVREIHTAANGQINRFWATFSHSCHCGDRPLVGEVRYNSLLAPS